MKRAIRLIAVSFIALIMFFTMNTISFAATATVISPDIKLRKKADDTSTVLELIPKNEVVEVLEENEKWCKVKYKKITGYVHSEYVQVNQETENSSSNEENKKNTNEENITPSNIEEPLKMGDKAYINEEEKLYILPLINAEVIKNLDKNQELDIIQILNGWTYIKTEETTGWIRYDKLYKSKVEEVEQQTTPTDESENNNDDESTNNNGKPNEEKQETTLNKTGYVITDGINFRKDKNTSSKVIKVLAQNAKLTIIAEDGDWYKAVFKADTGYILKMYVSDKKVQTTSRSAEERTEETKSETVQTENKDEKTSNTQTTTNTSKGEEIANYAKTFLGYKYVYGGASPSSGFDCSGLTMYVYKKFGVSLSHSATAQSKVGTKVEKSDLQLGDLVFFSDYRTYKGIGHCGIYIGDNKFIHASTEKTGVIISSLTSGSYVKRYVTATRLM